jgi:hypothetical protein
MTKTATKVINEYAKTLIAPTNTIMTSLFIMCNMQVFRFTFAAI